MGAYCKKKKIEITKVIKEKRKKKERKVGTAKVPDVLWRKNSSLTREVVKRKKKWSQKMGVDGSAVQNLGMKTKQKMHFEYLRNLNMVKLTSNQLPLY